MDGDQRGGSVNRLGAASEVATVGERATIRSPATTDLHPRWPLVRRVAGYGGAATLSLYLVVKVIWVVGGLVGGAPEDANLTTAQWVLLNAATIVMSAVGVALALALAQPWGQRLPASLVVFFAWIGAGFLVPMLPYMALSGLFSRDDGKVTDTAMPAWETVFISIGFLGMAIGLAAGLPIYLRERWPRPFLGRVGDSPLPTSAPLARAAAVASVVCGALWLFWALGGTLGLARPDSMDSSGRLLNASWGLWAVIAGLCGWILATGMGARLRMWVPMAFGFVASGSLVAWNSWRLILAIARPGGAVPAENMPVVVVQHSLSIVAGWVLLRVIVRAARHRTPGPVAVRV